MNRQMFSLKSKEAPEKLSIREMQTDTMMRCPYTPVSTDKMKNSDSTRCWRGCEKIVHCLWECKWDVHLGKLFGCFFKK